MAQLFRQMTVCGVGLIGGSLALIARRAGLVGKVVGLGRSQANLDVALERGMIDVATRDPVEAARDNSVRRLSIHNAGSVLRLPSWETTRRSEERR